MRPTEKLGMKPAHVKACRAMLRDAPHINLDDARFALHEAERMGSEFLLSPAVLDALPGVRAADDVETLMRLKDAADGAPKNSAVARAWIRFSHLDLAASNWRQLIAVMEEDRAGGRR